MGVAEQMLLNQVVRMAGESSRRAAEESRKRMQSSSSPAIPKPRPVSVHPDIPVGGAGETMSLELAEESLRARLGMYPAPGHPLETARMRPVIAPDGTAFSVLASSVISPSDFREQSLNHVTTAQSAKMISDFHRDLFKDAPGKVERTWKDKAFAALCLGACFGLMGYIFFRAI
jgi:hypothetical protein